MTIKLVCNEVLSMTTPSLLTCVGDGEASTQTAERGAGAVARLAGKRVPVLLSATTYASHGAHRLQAHDLAVAAIAATTAAARRGQLQ